jgi:hypothetical protein
LTTTYYDYRITNTQKYLENLNKQRDATIERLKAATKYNSTQQLLEKYGSSPKPKESPPASKKKGQGQQKQPQPGPRTGMAPPPTANIQRPNDQRPSTPQRLPSATGNSHGPSPLASLAPQDVPSAEFAPNAFGQAELTRQYTNTSAATFTQTHWYDRILDALLGEDETQPKNRVVLICHGCRLVNGQAPPGVRTLEDLGRWRCSGCGAWNGEEKTKEDDVAGLMQGWAAERKVREKANSASTDGGVDSDNRETEDDAGLILGHNNSSGVDLADESTDEAPVPLRSTRSRSKAGGKR